MSKEIEIIGLEDIDKKLAKMLDPVLVSKSLGKACALVERSAKQKAPKDTGALRRSITSKVDPVALEGTVFTPLEYAPLTNRRWVNWAKSVKAKFLSMEYCMI